MAEISTKSSIQTRLLLKTFCFLLLFLCRSNAHIPTSLNSYEILKEETIFSRWRSIISRVVKIPSGYVVDYDVSVLKYKWKWSQNFTIYTYIALIRWFFPCILFFLQCICTHFLHTHTHTQTDRWSKRCRSCHNFCMGFKNKNSSTYQRI